MRSQSTGDESMRFSFNSNQCCIEFVPTASRPYQQTSLSFYWKIGITLKDLDVAVAWLRQCGIEVTTPTQFLDIGYLCHLRDPNGFVIELLQQGFRGNAKPVIKGHPFGAEATFAHISLRVTDIDRARDYFENKMSMRLMSIQPVDQHVFCLYFFAWSNDVLPNSDLTSVANREWLWSRPYTLIELQHLYSQDTKIRRTQPGHSDFYGFHWADMAFQNNNIEFANFDDLVF